MCEPSEKDEIELDIEYVVDDEDWGNSSSSDDEYEDWE